jgi:osmotically-inducible protein OsmY
MRSSSLDLLTVDSPRAQVDIESLVSHPSVNREALIREVDEIIHWAKWRKLRWHIRMRRNVLVERGAVGLAQRVDVDEIIQFASRVLGVETQEETTSDSIGMDESSASTASSPTAAQDTLRDHYSWGA